MNILQACESDLNEILALQYAAYQSEAELLDKPDIPPLTQTLDDLQAEFAEKIFLKVVDDNGKIIGSVRCFSDGNTVFVGKLIVRPEFQNRGIGTSLLLEVEKIFPNKRYELFTSNKSLKNISLYERLGYKIFAEKIIADKLTFVYLEKV